MKIFLDLPSASAHAEGGYRTSAETLAGAKGVPRYSRKHSATSFCFRDFGLQFWIRIVSANWLVIVRRMAAPAIVNVWQASGQKNWRSGEAGDMILFRPEQDDRSIAGYGFLHHVTIDFASQAWHQYGRGNGAATYAEFLDQIADRRLRRVMVWTHSGGPMFHVKHRAAR